MSSERHHDAYMHDVLAEAGADAEQQATKPPRSRVPLILLGVGVGVVGITALVLAWLTFGPGSDAKDEPGPRPSAAATPSTAPIVEAPPLAPPEAGTPETPETADPGTTLEQMRGVTFDEIAAATSAIADAPNADTQVLAQAKTALRKVEILADLGAGVTVADLAGARAELATSVEQVTASQVAWQAHHDAEQVKAKQAASDQAVADQRAQNIANPPTVCLKNPSGEVVDFGNGTIAEAINTARRGAGLPAVQVGHTAATAGSATDMATAGGLWVVPGQSLAGCARSVDALVGQWTRDPASAAQILAPNLTRVDVSVATSAGMLYAAATFTR
ncbi:CAP domain-containing protein [Oerskovia enterophila]|uniref:LytR/CpsA/Psr regulator C-terminal domain-containing protein n=1 Tax=Oerskovia enterophila TaxID=43678 RepID=A0ABX2Y8N9_9CELL|nr:hypothetical protein [Oerskovia enterophila]OCI32855.1 hypothetical protein OERS_04470 [Oerskovia enterophila]